MGGARRGTVYLLVLVTVTMVVVVAISALLAVRVQHRAAQTTIEAGEARRFALAALELGAEKIASSSTWRAAVPGDGVWIKSQTIGRGTLSLTVTDPVDGSITNSDADPVVLLGTGSDGRAMQMVQAKLSPWFDPLSCLSVACAAAGNIDFQNQVVFSDAPICTNGSATAGGASVSADVQASLLITGSTYLYSTTALAAARIMPGASALDYYTTNGTAIAYSSLGGGSMDRMLLSPQNNPYGAKNANGIYVVDCQNKTIIIKRTRIVGTLVLLNPKSDSIIGTKVSIEPFLPNYPCLLVSGSASIQLGNVSLDEAVESINFNPVGTPYAGVTDADQVDKYPPGVFGLFYMTGNATVDKPSTIQGALVVGGTLTLKEALTLKFNSAIAASPPPGFRGAAHMAVVNGSWARIVQ